MHRKPQPKQPLPIPRSTSTATSLRPSALPKYAMPDQHLPRRHSLPVQPTLAPGQPAAVRNREKLVALPEQPESNGLSVEGLEPSSSTPVVLEEAVDLPVRGRLTSYCLTDSFDRKQLEKKLRSLHSRFLVASYTDVLYGQYWKAGSPEPYGDVFYFDYGVIMFWGLTKQDEQDIIRRILSNHMLLPLPRRDIECDELEYCYQKCNKPYIQNDIVTMHHRLAKDHKLKLAISFAISQSTKLLVYEQKILDIVKATRDLPEQLATTGEITLSSKAISKLIGEVFIQKSEVNLLSTVLDTPDFFWGESDSLESIYKSVCDYLEFDARVEVLNNRFQVLQEMLEIARDHQNNANAATLEWIVIWLIAVDVIILVLQLTGTFGFIRH